MTKNETVSVKQYVKSLSSVELINLGFDLLTDSIRTLRAFEVAYFWIDQNIRNHYLFELTNVINDLPEEMKTAVYLNYDCEVTREFTRVFLVDSICSGLEMLIQMKKLHKIDTMSCCSKLIDSLEGTI